MQKPNELWPHLRLKQPEFPPMGEPNFTYQDIQTVINITEETIPSNNHVRIGGYVHISESVVFLTSNVSNEKLKVTLNYADTYPGQGTLIEVFGKIFLNEKSEPYIQGYFHRDLHGSYEDYKELCRRVNELRNSKP